MKLHVSPSSLWLPLLAIALLMLAFIMLVVIAEPGARLPPLVP